MFSLELIYVELSSTVTRIDRLIVCAYNFSIVYYVVLFLYVCIVVAKYSITVYIWECIDILPK